MYYTSLFDLFLISVALGLFAFLAWWRLSIAFYLVVFLLPAYLVRFMVGSFPTTFSELSLYITFIIWLIREFKTGLEQATKYLKSQLKKHYILFIFIALLLSGLFLSTTVSINIKSSLGIVKGWFINPLIFLIPFLLLSRKNPIKSTKESLLILAYSGSFVALTGLGYLLADNLTYDGRLKAFFEHPNHLAMYLTPAVIILIGFIISNLISRVKKSYPATYYLLPATCILFLTLFFSYSAGAWVGLLVAAVFYLLSVRGDCCKLQVSGFKFIVFGLVIIGLFLPLVSLLSQDVFPFTLIPERSSMASRLIIWKSALYILKDHFFFGIGPGQFQKYYLDYQRFFPPYLEWAVPQPHNIYLAFWLQSGFLGLLGFLGMLFWFFYRVQDVDKKRPPTCNLIICAIMLYTLTHGLIDTLYWKNDLSIIFWLLIGGMLLLSQK